MDNLFSTKIISWGTYTFTVGNLVAIILIFVLAKFLMYFIRRVVERRFRDDTDRDGRKFAIIKLISYVVWVFTLLSILQTAGVNLSLILAGSAALLVGIGLGLQQTFNDFISGFILLVDRTIEINDVIEVDGMIARVDHIGMRASNLITRDDIAVIVPNSKITGSNVINWSHTKKQSRFHIAIGVAYKADEELVRKVLLDCALSMELILREPCPFVRLVEFANSSVNFNLYFWTSDVFRVENIKSDLRFLIVKKLRENKITIPFPQMDLYIKENKSSEINL